LNDFTAQALIERKKRNWPETCTPAADLMIRLYRVRDIIHATSRRRVKREFGLTQAEYEVIVTLRTVEPPYCLTPTQLHRSFLITPGGVTKVLNNLQARGLITRSRLTADGRSRSVKLTPKGIALAEKMLPQVLEDYRQLLSAGLGAAEMRQLSKLLGAALKVLEAPTAKRKK
jgi:DNA-binding MarR family transcriptional regulator